MIKLPAFFSDGMVISKKAKIWGWGEPGQKISIGFLNKDYEALADDSGRFEFTVLSENYGGPYSMKIGDKTISDVYVGRVWLCGGQSNMEGPIVRARMMWAEHIIDDNRIRAFQVEKGLNFHKPETDVVGKWSVAAGDVMDSLYAVPYFFARQLLMDDSTPIGLVCNPAGGTPIEGWLPEEIIEEYPDIHKSLKECQAPGFIDKETEEGNKRVNEWHSKVYASDTGIKESWNAPEYNDDAWETRMLLDPGGLPSHGVVWLRKTITLPKISGKVTLKLGRAENSVKVYVNGQQVISVDYMYPPCVCSLPEDILKEGENVIAIRLVGDSAHPKFIPGKEYALVYENGRVNLDRQWKWRVGVDANKCEHGAWFYGRPCGLYNHMLSPVLGYSADGMIWYQGESNTGHPQIYKTLFTRFVQHVREYYGKDFPIIFNQLANYVDPGGNWEGWVLLREQQRKCLDIPKTAMSVSIDCGEWNDLHPLDKKTVGERLALHARRLAYNEDIVSDGPTVTSAKIADDKLTITFNYATGLWANNGHPVLDIVDDTGDVHRLYATVKGETLTTDVSKLKVSAKTVRFGWCDCPSVALYNAYNLPASPFEIHIS